ncbi:MAG TPA: hypothetical protein H9890_00815 [Candidatus Faecalibacterium intestinigallinarum]|uniref:Uncharacterized protein n=1 Tax=Candidatus Faecalibacterium intestinigallinarum TaxID=2838581 RepID=A0A9D1Q7B7_9FIRM|nr:hypothetical protein [Candidatus Faecalibacterium intestinigallinarum]
MMKKKIVSLLMCLLLCIVAIVPMSASAVTPAVAVMDIDVSGDDYGWTDVDFYFRNNSGKTIKYIDFYVSAYNRVGDLIHDEITFNATKKLTGVGPTEPFVPQKLQGQVHTSLSNGDGTPFSEYREAGYMINDGQYRLAVYLDKYNNFFTKPTLSYDANECVYLSDYEINNMIYSSYICFDDVFYNDMLDSVTLNKIVVTYMDGSQQTISGEDATVLRNEPLQNQPFLPTVARYSAVYNYEDYKTLNPDLVAALGDNEKLLFEHFINNGMKEGRQGSTEFNLATYKANNPDLVAAFGDDNVKYYEHYISSGKAEGRKAV